MNKLRLNKTEWLIDDAWVIYPESEPNGGKYIGLVKAGDVGKSIIDRYNSHDRLVEALKDCLKRKDDPSAILHIVNIALRDAGEEA